MKRAIVVGAAGFVGRHLTRELVKAGFEVIAGVRNLEKAKIVLPKNSKILFLDICEAKNIFKTISDIKPDYLINLAAAIIETPHHSFEKVHVEGVKNLVTASQKLNLKKFVQMSVLGASRTSKSKFLASHAAGEEIVKSSGLNFTIFQPSFIWGPEQKIFTKMENWVKIFPIIPVPNQIFQPVRVEQVCKEIVNCLTDSPTNGKTIKICGPKILTLAQILTQEFAKKGRKTIFISLPKFLFYFAAFSQFVLKDPLMTFDQLRMLGEPNICEKINTKIT